MTTPRSSVPRLAAALLVLAGAPSAQEWSPLDVPVDPAWNRAFFEDVSALPDGTAWAVGYAQLPSPPYGPEQVTLAMHWDGQAWTHTPTPYVAPFAGGANDSLLAVDALAPDDVWAAGFRYGAAGGMAAGAWLHVLHWDGASWSEVPVPPPPSGTSVHYAGLRVIDIAAVATDDVWFSGRWAEPTAQATVEWRPLLMHWDGSGMTVSPTPTVPGLSAGLQADALAAVASNDIWAICNGLPGTFVTPDPVILHWDGSSWSHVPAPSVGTPVVLRDVVAVGPDDVWFFGSAYNSSLSFALHWSGGGLALVSDTPYVAAAATAAAGPGAVLGGAATIHELLGGVSVAETAFPSVDGPSVLGMDTEPSCSAWAVGRRIDSAQGTMWPFAAVLPLADGCGLAIRLMCVGDGTGGACPCGNTSPAGADAGCAHSFGGAGALRAVGAASVASDGLQLHGSGMTDSSALYFQGSAAVEPVAFGDGLLCAGGTVTRLRAVQNVGGASSVPAPGDPPLSTQGSLPAGGGTVVYQAWYRNVAPFCTAAGFNFTNAVRVVWAP